MTEPKENLNSMNTDDILKNDLEKDLKQYSKEQLLKLLQSTSALKIYKTKNNLKTLSDLHVYLCKLADQEPTTYQYRGVNYKILDKAFLDETFSHLSTLFELFKLKMPVINETDPLVIHSLKEKGHTKNKNNLELQKGSFYCVYRDYEKNTSNYIYFRILK